MAAGEAQLPILFDGGACKQMGRRRCSEIGDTDSDLTSRSVLWVEVVVLVEVGLWPAVVVAQSTVEAERGEKRLFFGVFVNREVIVGLG